MSLIRCLLSLITAVVVLVAPANAQQVIGANDQPIHDGRASATARMSC